MPALITILGPKQETSAQTSNARFYFAPSTKEFKKGCRYSVQVMIDPGSNTSNAANIYIDYDPSKIEILDSNSNFDGVQIGTGNAYEAFADNVVDEAAGRIRLTGFSIMYPLEETRTFATISFRSRNNAESANFSIWFENVGHTLDSNIAETTTSDDILGSVGSASYTFIDGPCVEDTQPPVITPQDPTNYEVEVPLDSNISVRICDNRTWDSGVDIDTVEVIINGETFTIDDLEIFSADGDPECYDIVIDPPENFPDGEAVSVTFKADDFKGNSASRSIIFNLPEESNECIEELYETRRIVEECEQRQCLATLPQGGVEEVIRENETIADTVAAVPVVTGIASLLTTLGFSLLELPYYLLQLFFWLLNVLGIRKKGVPWGVVYDSVSKAPIPRAVIRLFSQGKLLESRVTDVNGVFYLTPKKGVYTLIASKQGYTFPSTTIVGESDGARNNIYKGGPYKIKSDKDIVRMSIPLDPVRVSPAKAFLKRSWSFLYSFLMMLNPILLVLGIVIAAVVYYFTRDNLNIVWFVLNTVFLGLHFYVKYLTKSKWGYVVDLHGNPMAGVEVGLYDKTYGRLIDSRVTDEKGRYSFVVPGDLYTLKPANARYAIDDPQNESGYTVGKKTKGDISINQKMVVRRVS
jgi:hypothetical protein